MEIFTNENGIIKPTKEILLVFPFDEVWYRDTDVHKVTAHAEFAYVELLCNPKKSNPFYGYPAINVGALGTGEMSIHISPRAKEIIKNKFREDLTWQPDDYVKECVRLYQEFFYNASPKLRFYEAAVILANRLDYSFRIKDPDAINAKTGNPLYKPKDITSALIDTEAVLAKLDTLKQRVDEDLYTSSKTKADKIINDDFER